MSNVEYYTMKQIHHDIEELWRECCRLDDLRGEISKKEKMYLNECTRLKRILDNPSKIKDYDPESDMDKFAKYQSSLRWISRDLPNKTSRTFTRILGKEVSFSMPRSVKRSYKHDYEKYKQDQTIIIIFLAIISIIFYDVVLMTKFTILYVFHTYIILVARESVLRANGSEMLLWWTQHHYLSLFCAGAILLWPQGEVLEAFRPKLVYFILYTSIVQYLQCRYQLQRLYQLISLSKANTMDLVADVVTPKLFNELLFLLPYLLGVQWFQYFIVYTLIGIIKVSTKERLYPTITAMLFLILGCGNTYTTIKLISNKYHEWLATSSDSK